MLAHRLRRWHDPTFRFNVSCWLGYYHSNKCIFLLDNLSSQSHAMLYFHTNNLGLAAIGSIVGQSQTCQHGINLMLARPIFGLLCASMSYHYNSRLAYV